MTHKISFVKTRFVLDSVFGAGRSQNPAVIFQVRPYPSPAGFGHRTWSDLHTASWLYMYMFQSADIYWAGSLTPEIILILFTQYIVLITVLV